MCVVQTTRIRGSFVR